LILVVSQGFAKGSNIPLAGQKQISWYNGSSTSAAGATATPSKTTTRSDAPASEFNEEYGREPLSVHSLHDEEPAVIGWGGDEDEDGMGML
jgi:RNA-binding protein 26